FAQARNTAAKEAQFVVGVKATVAHPTAEYLVEPRNHIGGVARLAAEKRFDLDGQLRRQPFVRIEVQDPVAGAFIQRGVDLRTVALPALVENSRAKALGDLDGFIRGTRINEIDFV